MNRVAVLVALTAACGSVEKRSAEAPSTPPRAEQRAPPPESAPDAEEAPAEVVPASSSGLVCAFVRIGIDLRVLPTTALPAQREMFVRGEASDLTAAAGPGPTLDVRTWPGTGVVEALFGAESDEAAVQRCDGAVHTYIADAPRIPVTDDPAASVVEPCAPVPCSGGP